ncbi:MAG: MFS transporter [Burkholderiales bacterium]|nr:MFS transporter [Burkholderiales bacterium]
MTTTTIPAAGVPAVADAGHHRGRVLGAAIAGYAFDGVDLMVIALTLPLVLKEFSISMVQGGIIVTAMLLGAVLGGFIFGPIADKFGRKKALVWCIAWFGITTGLGGLAQDATQLAVLRFLAGLGLGAEWSLGATMLAETYPADKRGKANSYMQMGWPLGFIFALACQYLLVPSYGWRAMYFAGSLAVLVALYIQFFVPESPVWLKAQAAKKAGLGGAAAAAAPSAKLSDLFRGTNLKTFLYAVIICTSALMAYWGVNTWLPTLLVKERGMGPKDVSTFLMALNIVSLPVYFIASFIVDKIGKRMMIIVSAAISALSLYGWLGFGWDAQVFFILGLVHWATATAMWAGFGAYLAEQFPTNIRAVGVASSFSVGRGVMSFVPMALGAAATATASLTTAIGYLAVFYFVAAIGAYLLRETADLG